MTASLPRNVSGAAPLPRERRGAILKNMPSRDAQWIIGTILAAAVALSVQIAGLRGDLAEMRIDVRRLDDRLRTVEVEFGKVDQRLATLERLHLPTPNPADD